ncbi:MAG: hypothetical protein R3Y43_02790 [Alphaproteobacteria bacterium]
MIFLRPWYLLLLLIIPFLVKFIKKTGLNDSAWSKIVDKELLVFLSAKTSGNKKQLKWWVNLIGVFMLIIAISGPSWKKTEIPNYTEQNAVMLALDLSSDTTPEDLDKFKFTIQDLISETKNLSLGLVVYTNEPFLISPITEDKNVIANLLGQVNHSIMPTNGNDINKAKQYAKQKLIDAGFNNGQIIVLSNNENVDVQGFINGLNSKTSDLKESSNKTIEWADCGYYFLILPALICLYFFRRGLFAFLLLFSFNANAGLFLNANQEGLKSFEVGDYQTATQTFKNKDWQASSMYKSGDYKNAVNLFSDEYNQGNALAKSGDIEGAIKKYESVLAKNPSHEDAKFNLEYLKQQQQNQQQQNQNNQDNQDENQDKNQDEQNKQNQSDKNQDNQQQNKQQEQKQDDNQKDDQNNQDQNQNNQDDDNKQNNEQSKDSENNQDNQDDSQNNNVGDDAPDVPQDKQKQSAQQQEAPVTPGKESDKEEGEEEEMYSEKAQAREQQFREIPEDNGGLLRAFIYKEHIKRQRGQ